jgi:hypothetical protein
MLLRLWLLCKALVHLAFAQEAMGPTSCGPQRGKPALKATLLLNEGKLASPLLRLPIPVGYSLGIQSQAAADFPSLLPLTAFVRENQLEYRLQRARLTH